MTRPITCILVSLLLTTSSMAGAGEMELAEPVKIETGLIQGVCDKAGDVVSFKGIPYAAAPVGDLRSREPQPAAPWEGARKADQFGAQCPPASNNSGQLPWSIRTPKNAEPHAYSEDCLYLNVWTPAKSAGDKLPVLFYISPGHFAGEAMARKGILVVTLNHRIGIFGGLGHPELTRESPHHLSGNYGMLDMICCLQWVHRNIAAFGGDPDKVTLAGYSVGSTCVHHLTTSPVAKGLFRGAICMSFPYDYLTAAHKVGRVYQKEQEGLKFAEAKKAKSIADLRKLSADDLLVIEPTLSGFTRAVVASAFCLDGWSLTTEYPVALDAGLASDVPTLTGITADDAPGLPPVQYLKTTVASYPKELPAVFGEKRADVVPLQDNYAALFTLQTDDQARQSLKTAQLEYRASTVFCWAKRRAKKAATPVYTYLFEQAIPCKEHPEFGAFHTSDLVYEFNNLDTLDYPWTADDRRVAEQASSYWANFVKTLNPNGDSLPIWVPFHADSQTTMVLGAHTAMREIAAKERQGFYRSLLEK